MTVERGRKLEVTLFLKNSIKYLFYLEFISHRTEKNKI